MNEQGDVVIIVQECASNQISTNNMEDDVDYIQDDNKLDRITDPLETVNRVVFSFNDKLYF